MIGTLPECVALRRVLAGVLDLERAKSDPAGIELVDRPHPLTRAEWPAYYRAIEKWIGRRPHPALDGGHAGALLRDPRVGRYARARLVLSVVEEWRQADAQVGGPKILAAMRAAVGTLPELANAIAGWPAGASTPGPADLRDPGSGTGHCEW